MKYAIPYIILYIPTIIYISSGAIILYNYRNKVEYINKSRIWLFCLTDILFSSIKGCYITLIKDVMKCFMSVFGICIFLSLFEILCIVWGLHEYNYPFNEYNLLYYLFLVSITINIIYLFGLLSIPIIVLIYKHFYMIEDQTTP